MERKELIDLIGFFVNRRASENKVQSRMPGSRITVCLRRGLRDIGR